MTLRSAVVTGASSGIGAATARLMASQGTTVGLVGRRQQLLAAVLDDCRSHVPDCQMWVVDLADLDAAGALADMAWQALGGFDALINNAATPKVRPANEVSLADVEHAMRVNFFSPVRMTLTVLPRMLKRGHGWIVNVASVGGRLGIPHEAAYCASKFALCGWSEAMAIDLHGTGVRVQLIQPGPVDTDIWDRPGEPPAVFHDGPKVPPSEVAEGIIAAFDTDRFEHYLPDMKAVVTGKDADIDSYIANIAAIVEAMS